MRPNMAITNFTSRCLNGDPPVIYGDGQQTRDFTYIDDVVDANLTLLDSGECDGEIVNVGSTRTITIEELATHVVDETEANVELEYADPKEADARHTHADVSKACDLLDYEPSTGIREGVSQFVDWYQDNKEWYEPRGRRSRPARQRPVRRDDRQARSRRSHRCGAHVHEECDDGLTVDADRDGWMTTIPWPTPLRAVNSSRVGS